ncbi:hypothetical protein C0993_002376 [Termitomyces sp. T159_Od127]|nr:hypothetical protein C0993_002376 [Termitomyces sp. T159_Od127]
MVRSVAFKYNGKGGVEVAEDGGRGKGFFEEGEDTLAFAVSVPWGILPHETVEEFGDLRVVMKELSVEVGKTKKGLHLGGQLRMASTLDVVKVHNDEDIIYVMEDVVHKILEGGREVGHIKGHHEVLKEAVAGLEGGFPFMLQGYADIVVAKAEVNFSIDFGTAKAVNKVTNEGEGILVLFGDFVEAQVVDSKV